MLAAIACEVKIKTFLADMATPQQGQLVELVLENPRDVSMAAASLFDKSVAAVVGVSMKDEDRELYKSVELVFQHRNRFAHHGEITLDGDAIRRDLQAARKAFAWLDALRERN